MASTIRTFIAVPLSPELVRTINGFVRSMQSGLPEYRWLEPEQMHITLNFLGEIPDAQVGDVCGAVDDVAANFSAFECCVGGLGAFPKPARPRILWLGIDQGQQHLVRLHHDLAQALLALGIEPERKRYRPHLTLARIRNQERWPDTIVEQLGSGSAPELTGPRSQAVDEIVVFSSFLEPGGPVYTPMSRVELSGA